MDWRTISRVSLDDIVQRGHVDILEVGCRRAAACRLLTRAAAGLAAHADVRRTAPGRAHFRARGHGAQAAPGDAAVAGVPDRRAGAGQRWHPASAASVLTRCMPQGALSRRGEATLAQLRRASKCVTRPQPSCRNRPPLTARGDARRDCAKWRDRYTHTKGEIKTLTVRAATHTWHCARNSRTARALAAPGQSEGACVGRLRHRAARARWRPRGYGSGHGCWGIRHHRVPATVSAGGDGVLRIPVAGTASLPRRACASRGVPSSRHRARALSLAPAAQGTSRFGPTPPAAAPPPAPAPVSTELQEALAAAKVAAAASEQRAAAAERAREAAEAEAEAARERLRAERERGERGRAAAAEAEVRESAELWRRVRELEAELLKVPVRAAPSRCRQPRVTSLGAGTAGHGAGAGRAHGGGGCAAATHGRTGAGACCAMSHARCSAVGGEAHARGGGGGADGRSAHRRQRWRRRCSGCARRRASVTDGQRRQRRSARRWSGSTRRRSGDGARCCGMRRVARSRTSRDRAGSSRTRAPRRLAGCCSGASSA